MATGWGSNPCTGYRFLYSSKPEDLLQGLSSHLFKEYQDLSLPR
jgi:hypothetical protein